MTQLSLLGTYKELNSITYKTRFKFCKTAPWCSCLGERGYYLNVTLFPIVILLPSAHREH